MKNAKIPPTRAPKKHWYLFGVNGVQTLTAVRGSFKAEAEAYAKLIEKHCIIIRFERIPAVKAYALLRAFAPMKPYGEIRAAICKTLRYAKGED